MPDPASAIGTDLDLRLPVDAAAAVDEAHATAREQRWAERLWDRDTTLWGTDEAVQASASERLGWLDAPDHFTRQIPALEGFARGVREAGFRTAVVMGMGGSSLAPEVLARTFGVADGGIDVRVLDSTDPENVSRVLDGLDPLATLFIVASKSGTTTEPLAFKAEAWARIQAALEAQDAEQSPGTLMAAITDPGKPFDSIPHHDDLREVFLNPPDVGGRYSALTYVGLVPAALLGLDLDALLANASAMLARCRDPEPAGNPGVALGIALGTLARAGKDKLTFLPDPEIASFGSWAEQLIAESTGKHGVGIVPVDLEPLGAPAVYGEDRVFVRLTLAGSAGLPGADALLVQLEPTGDAVIRIHLAQPLDIAGEFVRWEVATAIAGVVLGIDPFDQPNVEEAKELTRQRLDALRGDAGSGPSDAAAYPAGADLDVPEPDTVPTLAADRGIVLIGDRTAQANGGGDGDLVSALRRHLDRRLPTAYLALQAFIAPTDARTETLTRIRARLRDATGCATTLGYGPRFLHSTGQLHKGGAPIGWFLQLTADHPVDRPIPGWPYTFGQLIDAQAAGDFAAIESHDLPILRVHLGADPDAGLRALEDALAEALGAQTEA
jgi:glucose-6-phosphate isomerase